MTERLRFWERTIGPMKAGQEGPEEPSRFRMIRALHLHALQMTVLRPFGKGVPWSGALVGLNLFGLHRLLGLCFVLACPFGQL